MAKFKKNKKHLGSSSKGLPPGSSVYIGENRDFKSRINVYSFDLNNNYVNSNVPFDFIKDLNPLLVHWIDFVGVHDVESVNRICKLFAIHPLTEEDILNTMARPKCEIYEEYIHSGLKIIKDEKPDIIIEEEHLSIILLKNTVITFQETMCDVFDPIRKRLQNPDSRARRKKADYLFFLFHDVVIDNYLDIVDVVSDVNDQMESEVLSNQDPSVLNKIQNLKSDLLYLKKNIFPVKESINKMLRATEVHIHAENLKYFNDLSDHLLQVTDNLETQREIATSHRDLYMSMTDISMNNIMKILTIVTSIFIPLTFIVGVYGMNFDNMPELRTRNGYFIVLGIMAIIAFFMLIFFKRKKWL
jgi:magnesium transporter